MPALSYFCAACTVNHCAAEELVRLVLVACARGVSGGGGGSCRLAGGPVPAQLALSLCSWLARAAIAARRHRQRRSNLMIVFAPGWGLRLGLGTGPLQALLACPHSVARLVAAITPCPAPPCAPGWPWRRSRCCWRAPARRQARRSTQTTSTRPLSTRLTMQSMVRAIGAAAVSDRAVPSPQTQLPSPPAATRPLRAFPPSLQKRLPPPAQTLTSMQRTTRGTPMA